MHQHSPGRQAVEISPPQSRSRHVHKCYYALVVRRFYPTESLPESFAPQFPDGTTGALLARLAVDQSMQGNGVGGTLLVEAMQRIKEAAAENGAVLLCVDAKDGQASFYLKYGFTPLTTDSQTLFIRVDEIPEVP